MSFNSLQFYQGRTEREKETPKEQVTMILCFAVAKIIDKMCFSQLQSVMISFFVLQFLSVSWKLTVLFLSDSFEQRHDSSLDAVRRVAVCTKTTTRFVLMIFWSRTGWS